MDIEYVFYERANPNRGTLLAIIQDWLEEYRKNISK